MPSPRSSPRAAASQGRVVAANGPARERGIHPGMGLASAWGLAPELAVHERDPAAESAALAGLACWGFNFTPQVCLDPPAGLLLEIGGCLRLFGGLEALVSQVAEQARRQGYTLAWGLAPTPLAARWQANVAPWLEPLAEEGESGAGQQDVQEGKEAAAASAIGKPTPPATARQQRGQPPAALAGGASRPIATATRSAADSNAAAQTASRKGVGSTGPSLATPIPPASPATAAPGADALDPADSTIPGDLPDAGALGDPRNLPRLLAPLPLDCLELPPAQARRLGNFGLRRVGDLLALPRSGLNQRLGLGLTTQLARALGEIPDSRPRFPYPETFRQGLELPARVEDAGALRFAARRLLQQLQGWLARRSGGISRCTLELHHEQYGPAILRQGRRGRPPTLLVLGFAGLTRDGARLERVLAERLAQLPLAAPVEALCLVADQIGELPGQDQALPGQGSDGALADDPPASAQRAALTLERLKARLGDARVYGLTHVADHRPEQATRKRPLDGDLALATPEKQATSQSPGAPPQGPRPLWLLEHPQALGETQGRPRHGGPLQLLAGPERIESGWWDEGESSDGLPAPGDLRRDYFVARNPAGEWLWVFRDETGWFLHGRFA
ncbi:hypothetical protein AZSI13_20820 [Azospira sp. I13]|nr:hypothetical protein AZSI13_20820 [Azospira sp. I13]